MVIDLKNGNYKNDMLSFYNEIKKASLALRSLSIYRRILESSVMINLQNLLNYLEANTKKESFNIGTFTDLYNKLYFELVNCKSTDPFNSSNNVFCCNSSLKQFIAEYVLFDENVFTKQAEKCPYEKINHLLKSAASNDLDYLHILCRLSCAELKQYVLNLISSDRHLPDISSNKQLTDSRTSTYENRLPNSRLSENKLSDSYLSFEKTIISNLPDWNITYDCHSGDYQTDICPDKNFYQEGNLCKENFHKENFYLEKGSYPDGNNEDGKNDFPGNRNNLFNNNFLINSIDEMKAQNINQENKDQGSNQNYDDNNKKECHNNKMECQHNNHLSSMLKKFFSEDVWKSLIEPLARFHYKWGYGDFARYRAFVWYHSNSINNGSDKGISNGSFSNGSSGYLKGIANPDPIRLSDLIGYETQRQEVLDNTLRFLKGYPANNMLLYGDRGTGKSSTIKALVNEYYEHGLRLVEVPKKYLMDFPDIIRILEGRKHKFIIFIDDLAFEDNEENYTALKAILEGGVKSKPSNVVIYATSNRRHLIKEKFSDRAGLTSGNPDEEIHASDTIQEKLSLADRFGIKVTFYAPDKVEFLKIVEGMAEKRGLKVSKEFLHKEALKWELTYNGRSPRTAKQFIDWLEGYLKEKGRV